ncbi:MAG: sterol carrier family protein [Actinomycetes bacterium]
MKQDLEIKIQVKQILMVIEEIAPGRTVELRIPPYAAIQCVEGGNHRRGTPPNVVEMDAQTLLKLSKSPQSWDQLCLEGSISASGTNSNLAELFTRVSTLISNFHEGLSDGK